MIWSDKVRDACVDISRHTHTHTQKKKKTKGHRTEIFSIYLTWSDRFFDLSVLKKCSERHRIKKDTIKEKDILHSRSDHVEFIGQIDLEEFERTPSNAR